MKTTKGIISILVAIIMAFTAVSATAFAAEVPAGVPAEETSEGNYYEFTVEADGSGVIAIPTEPTRATLIYDNTWDFRNHYTGPDMVLNCDYIKFSAYVTDYNGNASGDTVAIDLNDYYLNTQTSIVYADGTWYNFNNISVNYGDTYYFYYDNLTSNTRKLHITMRVYTL